MIAALAAGGSAVTVHWVVFVMILTGLGVVVLLVARRLWLIELFFTGVFFLLVGATPLGQAIYHAIDTVGQR